MRPVARDVVGEERAEVVSIPLRTAVPAAILALSSIGLALWWRDELRPVTVKAFDETHPVDSHGDAADDPAIWVDPIDPSNSLVLGTDKKGGLALYDLRGDLLQFVAQDGLNNVDVRDGFRLGSQTVTLVVASDKETDALHLYRLDPDARRIDPIPMAPIRLSIEGMGVALFHDRVANAHYAFGVGRDEHGRSFVEQFELDGSSGIVDAKLVRRIPIGRRAEGCVVDDEERSLYVSEEREGVWRIGAAADAPTDRHRVLRHWLWNGVTTDLEGLALVRGPAGQRLLVVSHQGDNEFLVLDRDADYAIVGRFTIVDGKRADAVSHTDGIDVVSTPLGDRFPGGLLVVQDGHNRLEPQNFKYVRWDAVLAAIGLDGAARRPVKAD